MRGGLRGWRRGPLPQVPETIESVTVTVPAQILVSVRVSEVFGNVSVQVLPEPFVQLIDVSDWPVAVAVSLSLVPDSVWEAAVVLIPPYENRIVS